MVKCSRGSLAWSLALLLGSVNAACGGYRSVPEVSTTPAEPPRPVSGTPLLEVWSHHASRGLSGRVAFSGDTVMYVGSADRRVTALDLRSGVERWKMRISGPVANGVVAWGSLVIAATELPDGRIYGLDAVRGSQVWKSDVGPVNAPLMVIDNVLVALTRTGRTVGMDPATGRTLWERRTGVALTPAVPADSGAMLVATMDTLFLLDAGTGRVLLQREAPGPVVSPWIRHDDVFVAGTADSQVIAVDTHDLDALWQADLDAPVMDSPVVHSGTIYAVSRTGSLYRISLEIPGLATRVVPLHWPAATPPVPFGDVIVIGGADGMLYALEPGGRIAWQMQLTPPISQTPIAVAQGLIVIGGRGEVYRYRQ